MDRGNYVYQMEIKDWLLKALDTMRNEIKKELIKKVKKIPLRTFKAKPDGGCVNCGYTRSGCVCKGYNQALNKVIKSLKTNHETTFN